MGNSETVVTKNWKRQILDGVCSLKRLRERSDKDLFRKANFEENGAWNAPYIA
jgi:hypothetical protein